MSECDHALMGAVKKGAQDTATNKVVVTPAWKKRQKTKRQREEAEWASKSGPVTVTRVSEHECS